MKPIKINHIAIVVNDIEESLDFWVKAFGLHLDHVEEVPSQASKVAFLPLGESEVELVQPTTTDSGMAAFLEKRGEGMHHLCIEVEDIEAALAHLTEMGVRLINTKPEVLPAGKWPLSTRKQPTAFLIELYQLTGDA
jgi:methylmalonyl-CoA/ethylmalonyl-CoA epimerase